MARGKSRFHIFLQLEFTQPVSLSTIKSGENTWLVVIYGSAVVYGLGLVMQHMDPMDVEWARPSHVPALPEFPWLGHRALRAPCLGTVHLWGVVFSCVWCIS